VSIEKELGAELEAGGSLTIWFDPEVAWEAKPPGKRGGQPDYSDAAIQTCLTTKVLFGMVDIDASLVRSRWRRARRPALARASCG
jgi:hypothetical protein